MKFGPVPVGDAEGKILAHNVARERGAFRKGRLITAEDVSALKKNGCETVYVAEFEAGDVGENTAARRIAQAACGSDISTLLEVKGGSQGRASLEALAGGILRVDAARLDQVNGCEGVAFATLQNGAIVAAGQAAAAIKVIPYALPEKVVAGIEALAARGDGTRDAGPLIAVRRFTLKRVGVIYSGSAAARERVVKSFDPPLRRRIAAFEAKVAASEYVSLSGLKDEDRLAEMLHMQAAQGIEMIVMAGETSTMDRNDIIPRAVTCAGGQVACVGAPVEPGNLVMLAYLGGIPVLGVPGCIRSPKPTRVDQILVRCLPASV